MAIVEPFSFGLVETRDLRLVIFAVGILLSFAVLGVFVASGAFRLKDVSNTLRTYLKFIYAIFFKPHGNAVDGGQQSALESFYATQVRIAQASIRCVT